MKYVYLLIIVIIGVVIVRISLDYGKDRNNYLQVNINYENDFED